jgi:hypothetical protein
MVRQPTNEVSNEKMFSNGQLERKDDDSANVELA